MEKIGKTERQSNIPDDKLTDHLVTLYQLMEQKRYDEGLKLVESVFNKNSSADWYTKGNFLSNLSRVTEALECYNEALRLDNRYVKCWYRKGNCLRNLKNI